MTPAARPLPMILPRGTGRPVGHTSILNHPAAGFSSSVNSQTAIKGSWRNTIDITEIKNPNVMINDLPAIGADILNSLIQMSGLRF